MRILYVAHSFGAWGSDNRIWDRNLRQTLVAMGCELIDPGFDPTRAHMECTDDRSGAARARYSELLLERVKHVLASRPFDLLFTYYDNRNIAPEAIDEIKRLGVLTVNFFCNAAHEFDKVNQVAPHFDYCVVPERSALSKYVAVGARPVHIQMAANPDFYQPLSLPLEHAVVFVGTRYLNREDLLLALHRGGIIAHVFGYDWVAKPPFAGQNSGGRRVGSWLSIQNWRLRSRIREARGRQLPQSLCHEPVTDDEMVKLFSKSSIVLGLSDVKDASGNILRHIRLRDFEVPMCGAFYLTGFQEELAEYYVIGKEIECYDTQEELVDKARFYLKHDSVRESIRQAGLARARSEHTWQHRFTRLFREIGLAA